MSYAGLAIAALLSTSALSAVAANDAPPVSADAKEQHHGCCDHMTSAERTRCAEMMKSHATTNGQGHSESGTSDLYGPVGGGA